MDDPITRCPPADLSGQGHTKANVSLSEYVMHHPGSSNIVQLLTANWPNEGRSPSCVVIR